MSNELVNEESKEVSTNVDMGISSDLSHDDCERGRIFVAQKNSTFLDDNPDLKAGDIVEMSSMEALGSKEESMEFIVVDFLKYWVVKDADTDEFIEKIPAINEKELKWEENINGRNVSRTYHFSYLVLLPQDIADGVEMPYELPFRSTALKASKRINSIIKKKGSKGVPSYAFKFKMKTTLQEKDNRKWYVPSIEVGDDCNESEKEAALECRRQFSQVKQAILNDSNDIQEESKNISETAEY